MMTGQKKLLAAGISLVALIVIFLNKEHLPFASQEDIGAVSETGAIGDSSQPSLNAGSPQSELSKTLETSAGPKDFKLQYFRSYRESEEAKQDFFKVASVKAHFTDDFQFRPIDMDLEDLTGIFGHHSKMDVAVIAGRMIPTDADVLSYLKSEDTGIPNVDREDFSLSAKAIEVDPIPGNGMKAGKYWTGKTKSGKEFRVGLMPREDGRGSYMVIISGDANWVNDSDEFFEDLYKSFKAEPPR